LVARIVSVTTVDKPVPLPEEFQTKIWDVDWFPDGTSLVLSITDPDEPRKKMSLYSVSMLGGTPRRLLYHGMGPRVGQCMGPDPIGAANVARIRPDWTMKPDVHRWVPRACLRPQ
jgi:hypothetical protein